MLLLLLLLIVRETDVAEEEFVTIPSLFEPETTLFVFNCSAVVVPLSSGEAGDTEEAFIKFVDAVVSALSTLPPPFPEKRRRRIAAFLDNICWREVDDADDKLEDVEFAVEALPESKAIIMDWKGQTANFLCGLQCDTVQPVRPAVYGRRFK